MNEPTRRMLILVIVVAVIGGEWWYFSKRSDCQDKISYKPSNEVSGAYYQACIGNPLSYIGSGCPKFATHQEALSACMWK